MTEEDSKSNEAKCNVTLNKVQSNFLEIIKESDDYFVEKKPTVLNINKSSKEKPSVGYINSSINANGGVVGYSYKGKKKVSKEDRNDIREFFLNHNGIKPEDWDWYYPSLKRKEEDEEYIVIRDLELAKKIFGIEESSEFIEELQLEEIDKKYHRFEIVENNLGVLGTAYIYAPENIDLPDRLIFKRSKD